MNKKEYQAKQFESHSLPGLMQKYAPAARERVWLNQEPDQVLFPLLKRCCKQLGCRMPQVLIVDQLQANDGTLIYDTTSDAILVDKSLLEEHPLVTIGLAASEIVSRTYTRRAAFIMAGGAVVACATGLIANEVLPQGMDPSERNARAGKNVGIVVGAAASIALIDKFLNKRKLDKHTVRKIGAKPVQEMLGFLQQRYGDGKENLGDAAYGMVKEIKLAAMEGSKPFSERLAKVDRFKLPDPGAEPQR